MKTFSFISHRFKSALEMAADILPSMDKAVIFYYNEEERKVLRINWSPQEDVHEQILPDIKVQIQKLRKNKTLTSWTNPKDLPFEDIAREEQQYSLTDEMENSILCLKFVNPFDGNYDLLYLYLNNSLSQFLMNSKDEMLSTGNKAILEKTLINSIGFILKEQARNKNVLNNIIDAKSQEKEERNTLTNELNKLKKNYAKSIVNFSLHHLAQISKAEGIQFRLSDSASQKLMSYVGDFERLETIIGNAASAAFNLSYDHREVVIDAGHIILYDYKPKKESSPEQRNESKYSKTITYLDRYEEAAQRLLLKDMAINGKNVAQFCQPSISAAAITINIRAHKQNILALMDRHPDKWNVLREHFRPIQNIMKDKLLGKAV